MILLKVLYIIDFLVFVYGKLNIYSIFDVQLIYNIFFFINEEFIQFDDRLMVMMVLISINDSLWCLLV